MTDPRILPPEALAEIWLPYAVDGTHVVWDDGELCVGNSRVLPLAYLGAKAKEHIPALRGHIAALTERVAALEGMVTVRTPIRSMTTTEIAADRAIHEGRKDPYR